MRFILIVMLLMTLEDYILYESKKIFELELSESSLGSQDNENEITIPSVPVVDEPEDDKKSKKSEKSMKSTKSDKEDIPLTKVEMFEAIKKRYAKELSKETEKTFKEFASFLVDVSDVCEAWDRKHCVLATAAASHTKLPDKKAAAPKKRPLSSILRFTSSVIEVDMTHIGIPLTVIEGAMPGKGSALFESIINGFWMNNELKEALAELTCSAEIAIEETSCMYSVQKGTTRYGKCLSYVFKIAQGEEKSTEIADNPPLSPSPSAEKTQKGGKGKKKRKTSSIKSDHISIAAPICKAYSGRFAPRSIINPGEIMKYEISFYPQCFGEYSHKYRIEIVGNRQCLFVKCTADCELPKLDFTPEIVFQNCVDNFLAKKIDDKLVYLKEERILDFGTILVAGPKTPPYTTTMTLKNISKIKCETSVFLEEDSDFLIEPAYFEIPVNQKVELKVSLPGRKKGKIESGLFVAIKNNPRIYRLLLRAQGSPLEFNIAPKYINFDFVPIDYSAKQYIRLTNSTLVDLKWRFVKCEWAPRIYKISKYRGNIKMNSFDRIEIEFKPTKEEIYPQRSIDIQIFDPLCSEDFPFLVENIFLQAESVEYVVDYTDNVDLGEIKGKVEYKFPLKLFNKGKTNVHLIFEKVNDSSPDHAYKKIRRIFSFNFTSEILQPQKHSAIVVRFSPQEEMEFQEVPIFICKFFDPNKPQNIIKSFQIKYSAVVLLSKFSICPSSGVHFGALELQNSRTQIINLKNTGKCHFGFIISNSENEIVDTRASRTSRNKATPSNMACLELTGYVIAPASGSLEAGDSVDITVTFKPTLLGIYKETVNLSVSEPIKELVAGKEITLYGEATEPWIDFQSYNKMFKEHYIVNNVEDLITPPDIGTHTYFVVSKKTLHFEYVCVKRECPAKIYLQNLGQLIGVVSTKIVNSNVFTVSPTQLTIDPYNTQILTVTFKPDSINAFEGKLEISTNATTNNFFEIMLHGKSYVPQIQLSELPPPEGNDNFYRIFFRPTYINQLRIQNVGIKNIGVLACRVIVNVTDSGSATFYVIQSDTLPELNPQLGVKENNLVASSLKISLKPSEITYVYLVFKPDTICMVDTKINIYTVDNPYETNKIHVYGHCYGGDIYIGNLQAFNPKGIQSKNADVAYSLDFGHTPLKFHQKKKFTITNNSTEDIYRFELKHYVETVKFIPKVGHLKPMASKEILAINTSAVPYSVSQELVSFEYTPISFLEEEQVPISWDERQQLLSWLENGLGLEADDPYIQQYFRGCVTRATDEFIRSENCTSSEVTDKLKVTLEREEPEVIFNSDECETIPIFMSFTADYAFYYSPITEITFSNTFIKEKSEFAFEVKNAGRVPLNIAWRVTYDEVIPKYPSVEIVNIQEHEDQAAGSSNSSLSVNVQHTYDLDAHLIHPNLLKIVPQKASIPPYETGQFRVFFSPLAACLYAARLLSDIESVHPDLKNMEITVTASSVVPDYYFELEESDYLKRRTVTKVLRYIDENSKILEICAIGIGVTAVKRVCVLNTSNSVLSFKMEPVVPPIGLSYINCKTPTGVILRGKKSELVFTFSTHELGDFEEEYCFSIEYASEDLDNVESDHTERETRFLVVGICRNPRVYFTVAHLGLAPTILRIPIQETVFLRNDEDQELGFKIIKESLYSYDHLQKLKIIPNSGTIMPKTEISMQLIYNAEVIGDSTFSIQCVVDTMTTPLNLNVSTKCMEVECKIQYIDQTGEEITLNPNSENIIDLGKIGIKSKTNLTFVFTNTGKTGFFYTWHYNKSHIEHLINITPKKDKEFISSGSSVKREVAFETFKKYLLKNFPMKIEISYGPIYRIKFHVAAEFPLCKFSFTNYNFENCLVQPYFAKYYSASLVVKNFEIHPVKLTNLFEDNENITVEFKSDLIFPKCETIIPIYFHPRKEGYYEFMIPMVLNCTKRFVKIIGTGVKLNIQLMRSADRFIDMGEVKIGDTKKYGLPIINRTPSRLEVTFFVSQDSSAFEKGDDGKLKPEMVVPCVSPRGSISSKFKKGSSGVVCKYTQDASGRKVMLDEEPSTSSEQKPPNFYIEPRNPVKMDFNKKYEFLLEFRPNERLENVTEKVFYQVQDYVIPLCSVKATCLVPEFSLDKKILTFSNVLVNMPRVKYVLLRNTGDIVIKFKWVCEVSKNFKVHPVEGQVNPKCDVKIDFTFSIAEVACQLVKKCKCVINNIHSLELTLVANSISKPPPVASIMFSCPVRQSITETVNIANQTKTLWHLNPVVSNKNFDIPAEILIEPESTSAVPVTYYPKQVINEEATLILSLPDEEILYEFIGMPLPPLPEKRMMIEIKSKQNHCEILPVYNWTDFKQCFEVESCLVSKASPKTLFKTFGLDLVDLLPGEQKDYRWNIYAINEEPLEFQVIFKDKQSNEYMYYDIAVKVQPPDPEEIIVMYAAVREPAKTKIKLKNPINVPVEYIITCPHPELHFKNPVVMLPYTTHDLEVTYLPVKSGDLFTTLEAKCGELGTFSYGFTLSAEKPANEKPLRFVVDIGSKGYATAEIKNIFPSNLDISAKLDNPEFAVEKYSKIILPNETASFSISFEPSALGAIESKLVINSAVSGPYVFPLYGECVPPMPKGPFFIKPGGTTSIPFFNPFNYAQVYSYSVDSKKFDLKIAAEEIKPRKTSKITVTCPLNKDKSSEDIGCPITGRLIVTDNGTLKWTFYLQAQSDRLSNQ